MRNIITILQKELRSYIWSPVAYAVLTLFLFITGFVYYIMFSAAAEQTAAAFNAPQWIVRGYFGWLSTILLFLAPLITMGVYAEEKKKGTYELLFTSPLDNVHIILGKFLANLVFALSLFAASSLLLLTLTAVAPPEPVPLLVGYLGMALFASAILSLGNFVSTLTENQIVSAALTFVLVLTLWFLGVFSQNGTEGINGVLAYLSPMRHLEDFQKGVLDLSHVVYFLSVTFLGLFLTYRSLDSLRWRG